MDNYVHLLYGGMPQLVGILSAAGIWVGLGAVGRLVTGHAGLTVAAPVYGWGVAVALFVILGVLTPISFTHLSIVLAAIAVIAAGMVLRRDGWKAMAVPAKAFLLTLPLILMVSAMSASQWDEFSHWLPSARFLLLADGFPDQVRPDTGASCPAYPYGWPLLMYFGARLTGAVQENVGPLLNLFMLMNFGLVILEMVRRQSTIKMRAGAWGPIAIGILLVTALNPSFVQKLVLTAYSETSTMVSVGLAAILAWILLDKLANKDRDGRCVIAWQLALVSIVLISTRQPNVVLLVIIVFSVLVVALRDASIPLAATIRPFAMALLAPVTVFIVWRFHVSTGLSGREFTILPFEGWLIHLIPDIVTRMAIVASKKGIYFGLMLIVLIFGLRALFRCRTSMDRFAILASGVFLGYNSFLLFTYVAAFGEGDALRAASYWRYNTHASLVGLTFIFIGAAYLMNRWEGGYSWRPLIPRIAVVLLLMLPLALSSKIRFDTEAPKPHIRAVSAQLNTEMADQATYLILDPKGTGESNVITKYHTWPDRRLLGHISGSQDKSVSAINRAIQRLKPTHLVVYSVTTDVREALNTPLAEDRSYLLEQKEAGWVVVAQWPYPPNYRN